MKKITPDIVYNNLYFFTYGNCKIDYNQKEITLLRDFVNNLFDFNKKEVKPFNEKETARIRSVYGIGPTLYEDEEVDLVDYLRRLYDYLLYTNKKSNRKTRG